MIDILRGYLGRSVALQVMPCPLQSLQTYTLREFNILIVVVAVAEHLSKAKRPPGFCHTPPVVAAVVVAVVAVVAGVLRRPAPGQMSRVGGSHFAPAGSGRWQSFLELPFRRICLARSARSTCCTQRCTNSRSVGSWR